MLEVKNLTVTAKNQAKLLDNICFNVKHGQVVGITGQSGGGKTTLLKSIMGILDDSCRVTDGQIAVDNQNLYKLKSSKRRLLCGTTLGFIPQNPMTAFDNRLKMHTQMVETLVIRRHIKKSVAIEKIEEIIPTLGLYDTSRILSSYPSQLSGGMLQRLAVVLLLALEPKYILADEPTSALDMENSQLLLDLLEYQKKNSGIIIISHDVNVLTKLCQNVYIIEHGKFTEYGTPHEILTSPKRSWTKQFAAANHPISKEGWSWKD